MKHFAYLLPVCCLLFAACRKDSPATEIIPTPRSVKAGQGTFDLGGGIRIAPADPLLRPAADYLAQLLREEDVAAAQDAGNANLSLELDPRLPQQGYTLKITPARIELRGGSCEGVVSAAASLRQLLWSGKGSLPALEIDDAPRFAWRGFMLDVARHFFTKEEVMSLTDRLACYKFNRLHLHLTDDQGWRIEIKRYPLLTRRGAWRTPNKHDSVCLRRAADERDPKFLLPAKNIRREQGEIRYGGYYTQDDIREIVAYAAQRGIEVIPEIDLPGHSLAAIGCYPQLACDGRGGWGKHFSTPLCIGRDSTIAFCKNVLTELFDLFPSQYVHIGGDEVERTPWETCPDCQRRIRAEKLEGAGELQAWFTRKTEQFLAAHGKTLLGWDEITEDGLTPQSAVMWWRSWMPSTLTAALQNGHRVIESPSEFLYLNGELDRNTLSKVYGWEPLPESLRAWQEGLLGIQANMWTEDVPTADAAGERLFPRLLAVAETAWSAPEKRDFADFRRRLPLHLRQLERAGWNYRLDDVEGVCDDNVFIGAATVRLLPPESAELYYTLDGTVPDTASQRYTAPFSITDCCTLTLRCYNRRGVAAEIRRASFRPTRYAEPSADAGNLQNGLLVRLRRRQLRGHRRSAPAGEFHHRQRRYSRRRDGQHRIDLRRLYRHSGRRHLFVLHLFRRRKHACHRRANGRRQRRSALPHRTQRTGRPAARRALLLAALLRHQRRHTGGRNHRLRRPAHPVFEPDAETLRQNRFPKPHARTRSLTAAKGKRSARQAVPQRRLLTLRKIQFTRAAMCCSAGEII